MPSILKNNLQGNVYAEVKLPLHLTFRSNVSYSYYEESQDFYQAAFEFGQVVNKVNFAYRTAVKSSQILTNYVLTYDQSFGGHSINAIAGFEQITSEVPEYRRFPELCWYARFFFCTNFSVLNYRKR